MEEELFINPEDQLLIYSDGICEAMNDAFVEFGEEKLKHIIKRYSHLHPEEPGEKIISAVKLHIGKTPKSDDMTMILLRRK